MLGNKSHRRQAVRMPSTTATTATVTIVERTVCLRRAKPTLLLETLNSESPLKLCHRAEAGVANLNKRSAVTLSHSLRPYQRASISWQGFLQPSRLMHLGNRRRIPAYFASLTRVDRSSRNCSWGISSRCMISMPVSLISLPPSPGNQTRQGCPQGVDRDIGPCPAPPWHECLMVLVQDREEYGEGQGKRDRSPTAGPREPVNHREREHEEDRKFGGMPTLDDGKPAIPPEAGESPEGRLTHEDMGGDPGEEVMG